MKAEYETIEFKNAELFREWLAANGSTTDGVWLKLYKKASGIESVTYAEALDEALCYGWIDGQRKSFDEVAFLQKYTPRRAKSLWSKRNIGYVERLIAEGRMTAAGLVEIDRAKADGRWDAAYDGQASMTVPEDFLKELEQFPEAKTFFDSLDKANIYAIVWRLQTATSDTLRKKRQATLIEMLKSGRKIH